MNFIFLSFKLSPQTMGRHLPIRSNPHVPSLTHLPYRFCRLLVGCCVLPLNGGYLWPTHVSLFFLMCLFSAPQTGKSAIAPPNPTTGASRGTIGIRGAIGWGHRCSTHRDRGAKPLEGRAWGKQAHKSVTLPYHYLWYHTHPSITIPSYVELFKQSKI